MKKGRSTERKEKKRTNKTEQTKTWGFRATLHATEVHKKKKKEKNKQVWTQEIVSLSCPS